MSIEYGQDTQEWLDELEFIETVSMEATKDELTEMYHNALVVISDANLITLEQAHQGIQLMGLDLDLSMVSYDISEELH